MSDKPIKICFVMLKAYPLFNPDVKEVFGGAEVDFYLLAKEMAKDSRYDVSCVVADFGQEDVEVRDGVTLIKSLSFKKNMVLGAVRLWQALKRADADVYVRELASGVTVVAALFAVLHKRKFVYRTAHSDECDGTYFGKFLRGPAFKWALRKSDRVIVQNDEDRVNLRENAGVDSVVIRNAHELPVLSGVQRDKVLWVARSAEFKRPWMYLDLADEMSDVEFRMICPKATEDDQYEYLVKRAGELDNVELIAKVPFAEIDGYFERATVFVSTSETEGFPNTYVQACKCATPILALKVNPDDFLGKHNCGYCAGDDWDVFTSKLREMLDSDLGRELGDNGRRYAEQVHDIVKVVQEYKGLIEEL